MNKLAIRITSLILASVTFFIGCEEDKNTFSIKPSLGFALTEGTVTEQNSIKVGFYSNVKLVEPVTATIDILNFQNLVYGVDFQTEPAAVDNKITVTIDPEMANPYFEIFALQTGSNKQIAFTLSSVNGNNLQLAQQTARSFALSIMMKQDVSINITHNFEGCTTNFDTPAGFIEAFEPNSKQDRGWGCREFGRGGGRAPRASAFGGSAGEDKAWLIMNPISIPQGASVTISYWTFSTHEGPGVVNVKWSSDYSGSGNPLLATWTSLATLDEQMPVAGSQEWREVTGTFNNISGSTVYLAFAYTQGLSSSSSSYDIDDLTVTVE